jgi:hypothetical protein
VQAEEPSLAAELENLRAAQAELKAGRADRALALLDDHPIGSRALEEERRAERIVALCRLGRVDDAQAESARFLKTFPKSPLAARVRETCRRAE